MVARLVFAAALLLATCEQVVAVGIVGQATVIDGDTLEIRGKRIRIWGVDAPESSQLCRNDASDHYKCGAKAANDLDAFIARRPVSCAPITLDRNGRTVAVCTVGDVDLADWLVRAGLAFDWPLYSKKKYHAAQRDAERVGNGMWQGSCVVPWLYRACIREGGSSTACSDSVSSK